jgi:hypothetical protein
LISVVAKEVVSALPALPQVGGVGTGPAGRPPEVPAGVERRARGDVELDPAVAAGRAVAHEGVARDRERAGIGVLDEDARVAIAAHRVPGERMPLAREEDALEGAADDRVAREPMGAGAEDEEADRVAGRGVVGEEVVVALHGEPAAQVVGAQVAGDELAAAEDVESRAAVGERLIPLDHVGLAVDQKPRSRVADGAVAPDARPGAALLDADGAAPSDPGHREAFLLRPEHRAVDADRDALQRVPAHQCAAEVDQGLSGGPVARHDHDPLEDREPAAAESDGGRDLLTESRKDPVAVQVAVEARPDHDRVAVVGVQLGLVDRAAGRGLRPARRAVGAVRGHVHGPAERRKGARPEEHGRDQRKRGDTRPSAVQRRASFHPRDGTGRANAIAAPRGAHLIRNAERTPRCLRADSVNPRGGSW